MEGESAIQYQNKSINKSCFYTEKKRYFDIKEDDEIKTRKFETKIEESKIQEKAMPNVSLRWNRDRKNSFCEGYRKGSKFSSQRL